MTSQTIKSSVLATVIFLIICELVFFAYLKNFASDKVQMNLLQQFPIVNLRLFSQINLGQQREFKQQKSKYFVFDGSLGYRFKPKGKVVALTADEDGKVKLDVKNSLIIDKYGYVANAVNQQRNFNKLANDKKIYKIVISGGSTVAGWGASQNEKTWPALLEKKLNNANAILQQYQEVVVINTGVLGYKIANEIKRFADETSYLNPHLVIAFNAINEKWGYQGNPVDYALHGEQYRMMNGYNGLDLLQPKLLFPYFRLFAKFLAGLDLKFNKSVLYGYKQKDYITLTDQQLYISKIKQFNALAQSINADFIYILQPLLGIGGKNYSQFEQLMVENFFGGEEFYKISWSDYITKAKKFYDATLPGLTENYMYNFVEIFNNTEETVYSDPRHYNDFGQELIAQEVYKLIIQNFHKNSIL